MFKPLKLHKYQKWIRQYGWSLHKGKIDWNLIDQNGIFVCAIKIQHPGPKEVVALSVHKTEQHLRNVMKKSKKTKFDKLVDEHLEIALKEIGPIKPWFSKPFDCWIFEHELYPESYGGDTKQEVIERYPLYIRGFIEHRLKGTLAPFVEARTYGRGGKRPGAGRPNGTKKSETLVVRLPLDIANWLKSDPIHLEQVRALANR